MDKDNETAERKKILEAEMTASPKKAKPGTKVVFDIKIINNGSSPLSNVAVKDCLPKGITYVSDSLNGVASGNVIDWLDLGSIDPGRLKVLKLKACVDGSEEKGPWTNKAKVSGMSSGKFLEASCEFEIRDRSRPYRVPAPGGATTDRIGGTSSGYANPIGGWSDETTISGWSKTSRGKRD